MARRCGKCGSGNVYWDDDGIGTVLACRTCGTRTIPPIVCNTTNDEEEESTMPKKPCANCGRTMWIVKEQMCSACARAADGKEGPEREAVLAEVKKRISSGNLRLCAKNKPNGKKTTPGSPAGIVPAEIRIVSDSEDEGVFRVPLKLTIEIGIRIAAVEQGVV